MKKLLLIFIICVLTLYSIMICYADLQVQAMDTSDLPLAMKYEPNENMKQLSAYQDQLQAVLAEQLQSLNTLNYIYNLGSYQGSFSSKSIYSSMHWHYPHEENVPLFNSDMYKGYYKVRTEKLLKQYQSSEIFDYNAFVKSGRAEFDSYIKGSLKDQSSREKLMILLQSKLADKLIELAPSSRKVVFDEILSLRQPVNSSKGLDYAYQILESRVRLQLLGQMVDMNKQKLNKLVGNINIGIIAKGKGQLLLQSNDAKSNEKATEIMNLMQNEEGYRGLALLQEFYSKQNYKLVFNKAEGGLFEIDLYKAVEAITLDEKGYLHLDLDYLMAVQQSAEVKAPAVRPGSASVRENQFKVLEQLYSSKSKAAQEIIKELNRYGIYMELKNKKISNNYTRSFEVKQKQWKKDMDSKLNAFGSSGEADFMAYLKQFEQLDRYGDKQQKENALIARFRNSDIQFKDTSQGILWLTDLLFRVRYMQ